MYYTYTPTQCNTHTILYSIVATPIRSLTHNTYPNIITYTYIYRIAPCFTEITLCVFIFTRAMIT